MHHKSDLYHTPLSYKVYKINKMRSAITKKNIEHKKRYIKQNIHTTTVPTNINEF